MLRPFFPNCPTLSTLVGLILFELMSFELISFELRSFELRSFELISFDLISFELISFKLISFELISFELISFELISFNLIAVAGIRWWLPWWLLAWRRQTKEIQLFEVSRGFNVEIAPTFQIHSNLLQLCKYFTNCYWIFLVPPIYCICSFYNSTNQLNIYFIMFISESAALTIREGELRTWVRLRLRSFNTITFSSQQILLFNR